MAFRGTMTGMTTMSNIQQTVRDLDRVENRIRQQRNVDARPILVVEGPTDLLVLRWHLPDVQIFPADGKGNALRAIRQLVAWGFSNVVAVVDRDFDDPTETDDIGVALHPYDTRDLEGMLIQLGVLAMVLDHQASATKLTAFGGSEALVEKLKDLLQPVSVLRSRNTADNLVLCFSKVDVSNQVDSKSLELRLAAYCKALLANSETSADLESLMAFSAGELLDGLGPRGKDVVAAGGVALRKVVGNLAVAATKEAVLTAQLHSSSGLMLAESGWLASLRRKLVGG
jgi:hypothetical protein